MSASIQAASGRLVPIPPVSDDDIQLTDIAHALARTCRFGGHTIGFYSVAQHSVLAAYFAPNEHKLQALLHDSEEAFLPDVPTPIKHLPELNEYRQLATTIRERILTRFGLAPKLADEIKAIDARLLVTEARRVLPHRPTNGWDEQIGTPYDIEIIPWSFILAERRFLDAARVIQAGDYEALDRIALTAHTPRQATGDDSHDANTSFAGGVWSVFCTCNELRGHKTDEIQARRTVYQHLLQVGEQQRARTYRLHFSLPIECLNCDDGTKPGGGLECELLGHYGTKASLR